MLIKVGSVIDILILIHALVFLNVNRVYPDNKVGSNGSELDRG